MLSGVVKYGLRPTVGDLSTMSNEQSSGDDSDVKNDVDDYNRHHIYDYDDYNDDENNYDCYPCGVFPL